MAENKITGPKSRRAMMKPEKKIEDPMGKFLRLMKFVFKDYAIQCIVVVICIFISVLANIQGTMFTQKLIDDYIMPMTKVSGTPDFKPLLLRILQVGFFYALGVLASYVYNRIMVNVGQGSLRNIRREMFNKMETLPIKYFDTHAHGDIMSLYTNDVDSLRQMISQSIPQMINSIITVVGILAGMIILSIPMTLVTLIMVAITMFVAGKVVGISGRYFLAQQKDLAKVNGQIEEIMNGQKVVKIFNHEEKCLNEFRELNDNLYDSARNANTYANIMGPINGQMGNLSYVICAMVGGALAYNNFMGFTIGKLVSFLTFNKSFNMPITQVSQQFNFIIAALAGADRIFELLDQQSEADDGYVELVRVNILADGSLEESEKYTGNWAWKHFHHETGKTEYKKLNGEVILDHVDFGYNKDKMILHDIELFAKPGQKIAFVGATGAGKTTITNLINRFYDIQDGKIRFDGININKIKKKDLRRSLGVVLQDTHLFTGTVMDNIRYGKLNATDDEVMEAAKLANAHGFIKRLPKGYETMLTRDGANLSQGQRQLIAIARAAVANPPALILDEATSSIDTRTEKLVQEGMDRLMKGRTTFVIAHRLSTVRNSDCIMVMEQGRIIERGTHDELIDKKGKYYQLYTGKKGSVAIS